MNEMTMNKLMEHFSRCLKCEHKKTIEQTETGFSYQCDFLHKQLVKNDWICPDFMERKHD